MGAEGLPGIGAAVVLALTCTIPSGLPRIVAARQRVIDLVLGPGFLPQKFSKVKDIIRGPVVLPLPLDTFYVGSGQRFIRVRPSPWCNPYAAGAPSEPAARAQFWEYARSRADFVQWLVPLSGRVLLAEEGLTGAHISDLRDMIDLLATEWNPSQTSTQPTTGVACAVPGGQIEAGGIVVGQSRKISWSKMDRITLARSWYTTGNYYDYTYCGH